MKKHIFLQNLMILTGVILLLLCFVPGTVAQTSVAADGAVTTAKYSLFVLQTSDTETGFPLFIQAVLLCIGAIAFRITEAERPLGWIIVASALGIAVYAFLVLKQNGLHIIWLVPVLLVTELLLSIGYKIGRHIGLLA